MWRDGIIIIIIQDENQKLYKVYNVSNGDAKREGLKTSIVQKEVYFREIEDLV